MEQRQSLQYVLITIFVHCALIPLVESLYAGVDASQIIARSQTAYKWSFASKGSAHDSKAIQAARAEVGAATYGGSGSSGPSRSRHDDDDDAPGPRRQVGPTLPSTSDLAYAREIEAENRDADRKNKRKRDNRDARDRVEDAVGPKEVGREGMLEKKRARREEDKNFREGKEDAGLEVDERTLLGGGDSFRDA